MHRHQAAWGLLAMQAQAAGQAFEHRAPGRSPGHDGKGADGFGLAHGGFGQAQVLERLVEIGAGGAAETVRALAEVDLVHVQLENLVLG